MTTPVWAFGVINALTLTDNIGLSAPGSEQGGTILEVSPYAIATIDRPLRQLQLSYKLRNFYLTPDEGYEGPRHDLRARGNAALYEDWLWLSGQAMVFDVSTSPFGATAPDPASRTGNRSRYISYDLMPYVLGRIGTSTAYEAGYGLSYLKYGEEGISSFAQRVRGRVGQETGVGGLGWLTSLNGSRRRFDNDVEYDTRNASLGALYRPTRSLRVGVSADYAKIDVLSVDGDNSGWGPGMVLNWRPSERTAFELKASDAYYGDSGLARLTHRAARWTFGLEYQKSLQDGGEAALSYLGTAPRLRNRRSDSEDDTFSGMGIDPMAGFLAPPASGIVSGALVWTRRFSINIDRQGLRNHVGLTFFQSDNESIPTDVPLPMIANAPDNIKQKGALLRLSRNLSPGSLLGLDGSFVRSRSPGSSLESDLAILIASWRYELTLRSSFAIAYRRSEQQSDNDASAEYTENAVLAAFDIRF